MPQRQQEPDNCPECGQEYANLSEIDMRPEGALFREFTHSYETDSELIVDESCTHVLEWGGESDHD